MLSEATIKTHVNHILTKLRLRDRVGAVILAYRTTTRAARPRGHAARAMLSCGARYRRFSGQGSCGKALAQ